jgi:hypothetical protein
MTDADNPTDEPDGELPELPEGDVADLRQHLSGLQKARAPATFAQDVTATIHKRSAGRFFARRTFGDRVPFGVLLIVALVGLAVIAWVLWSSSTGSLHVDHERDAPHGSASALIPHP